MSIDTNLFGWLQTPTEFPWRILSACFAAAFGVGTAWLISSKTHPLDPNPLADENLQLRSRLQLREWELDLTRRFLGVRDLNGRLQVLLDALVPDPQQEFAAVFRIVGNLAQVEQSVGLEPGSHRKLMITPRLVRDTLTHGSLAVSASELASTRGIEGLKTIERSGLTTLYCLRLGSNRSPWGLLICSVLPAVQLDAQESLRGWEHLTSILGEELASQESIDRQGNELALTREMLELRSLADQQFRSPAHMLQEFLRRLAELSDFERATLVLSEDEQQRCDVPLMHGGGPMSRDLMAGWDLAEEQLLTGAAGSSSSAIWTEADLQKLGVGGPFSFAVMLPLRHHEWMMGQLCLTRRSTGPISECQRKLIRWGANYLVELVARTVDRAAIEMQARRDGLTHLANRQTFDIELDRMLDRANRVGDDLSLILLDLDHFKSVNDTRGHLAGDAALKSVAHIVERSVQAMRDGDQPLVARYGGEELAVLLPGVGTPGARRIAESIREAVKRTPILFEGAEFHLTLSAGVAIRCDTVMTSQTLIASADAALYRAKANGRNRVEVAGQIESMPLPAALST